MIVPEVDGGWLSGRARRQGRGEEMGGGVVCDEGVRGRVVKAVV